MSIWAAALQLILICIFTDRFALVLQTIIQPALKAKLDQVVGIAIVQDLQFGILIITIGTS